MAFIRQLHPWRVSIKKALEIQERLRDKIVLKNRPFYPQKVAGVDVGYSKGPIFVSPGHKIDIIQSIDLVLKLSPKYRIPEPLRWAHRFSNLDV